MTKDYSFLANPRRRRHNALRRVLTLSVFLAILAGGLYAAIQRMGLPGEVLSPRAEPNPRSVPLVLPPAEDQGAEQAPATSAAPPDSGAEATSEDVPAGQVSPDEPQGAAVASTSAEPSSASDTWIEHRVSAGESLSRIFKGLGLSASLLHRIVHCDAKAQSLADIRPGQTLKMRLDDQQGLRKLVLVRSPVSSLRIQGDGESFHAEEIQREAEGRITRVTGVIEDSLYTSAQEAGLSDKIIMELAAIFGWDIDFALEIRSGDQFRVVYREDYLDGEKLGDGPILAAEFINRGRSVRAVRYEKDNGEADYYSPDGKSMRKAFLRSPVDFRRISSRFQTERYHPILGKRRPHRGVDYAAATGTPVRASGDGKIVHQGTKGGYGKTVVIKHGEQYTTLYAHLSAYRRGLSAGSRVKQGQVIGYVGQTGLATGPHLHYEFRVNGIHRNPLTVKLPEAEPIAEAYRADFEQQTAPLVAQLKLLAKTMLAEVR
jgi:murein DD-endopeptidase MepM/ murein hydrolase activator NlpD